MFLVSTILDVTDGLRIYVHCVDTSGFRDSPGGPYREPSRSRSDVRHILSCGDSQNVHHAVDLQPILAPRRIKDRQVAGVGIAGLARLGFGRRGILSAD